MRLSRLISTTETRFSSFGRLPVPLLLWRLLFLLFSMIQFVLSVPFLCRAVCVRESFFPVFLHVYVLLCGIVIDGIPFIRVIRLVCVSLSLSLSFVYSQAVTGVSWVLLVLYSVFSSCIGNSTHTHSFIHSHGPSKALVPMKRTNIRMHVCM